MILFYLEPSKRRSKKETSQIYMYKISTFFSASCNLRFSACLFHLSPRMFYAVPDKYPESCTSSCFEVSLVARGYMRKPVLRDWLYPPLLRGFTGLENLDVVSGSIIPMRGSRGGGGRGPDLPSGKSQVL